MKKLFYLLVLGLFPAFYACNNANHNGSTERNNADSIRTADSIRSADSMVNAREDMERDQYRAGYDRALDSMRASLATMDEEMKHEKGKPDKEWMITRERINYRMTEMKSRSEEAKSKSKEDWRKLRTEMDTTRENLRTDWNKLMEKMKIKKKH